jgi:hypothetical protein
MSLLESEDSNVYEFQYEGRGILDTLYAPYVSVQD